MDPELTKKPTNFTKEKILRFKPVAFLKKNIIIFSIILIFSLSLLLGLWKISQYEIQTTNGEELTQTSKEQIEKYIQENWIGKNYFTFSPKEEIKKLVANASYVESTKIEKIAPNKLTISVGILKPESVAYLKGSECYVLGSKGVVLEQICKDEPETCCSGYKEGKDIFKFLSPNSEISIDTNGKKKLIIMENLQDIITLVKSFSYTIDLVKLENDILEISTTDLKIFRFSMVEDIQIQLQRFVVVIGKVKKENIEFTSLDLRFDRPVMKNN